MAEEKIGIVIHYWTDLEVAGVKLTDGGLKVGDTVHVKGHTSDFTQQVDSIQREHEAVEEASPGDDIGIRVVAHAREHDLVLKVTPD